MRKIAETFWLVIINLLLLSNASMAASISDANYGSVVIRDGILLNALGLGHAGVVILPLFGNSPNTTDQVIAQANGPYYTSSTVTYSSFLGGNNYKGHFKTSDTQWDSPAFRADVVKFANQAMGKSYTGFLYAYPFLDFSHTREIPYTGVIPSDLRCDGVAEWSVEQALGVNGKTLAQNIGFYTNNSLDNNPISISTLGTDDSAFSLKIDSDSPSSGVTMTVSKADSLNLQNGSTGNGGTLKRLYSAGTTVTLTAPAAAPNGNVFSSWWGCTAANGGTPNQTARTCTTSMNMAAHYTASYVSPPVATLTVPTVSTAPVTSVTSSSATLNATIVSDGGSSILERRFDWGINGGAMTAYTANVSVSVNNFSYVLTGLLPNTTYKFRAWATNKVNPVSADWGTGSVLTFTTGSGAVIVNGVCASVGGTFTAAPTNLCSSGTSTTVSGSGPWYWNCNGSNGGTSNSCWANIQTWTVTPYVGTGGIISPLTGVTVNHGFTTTFTVTPNNGYTTASVSGCGGYLSGNTYTTGAITANCTVSATFTANPVPVNGVCGTSCGATFTVAPTTNLCSSGTATTVSGSGPWYWNCNGSNGGTPASCAANVTPTASAPSCNISPTTASIVSGAAQVFVASCTNSSTNFQWLLDGTLVGSGSINSYGTGTNLAVGSHTVTVTASNASGTSVATSASLTINTPPVNAVPVITSAGTASGTMNGVFSYPITASNSPTTYGASGLPAGLSVNTSNGLISGTPSVSGTFYAMVTATNATGTGQQSVTITITTGTPTPTLQPTLSSPVTVAADGGQQPRIKKWGNSVYVLNGDPNRNLMFYKSTDNGASFTSTVLATPVFNGYEYEFGMDTNGYLYALWESSNDDQLYIRKSLDGGTTWSAAASVASGFGWMGQPSCSFSNGTLYVLFRGYQNLKIELFLTKSTDNGGTFSTPVQVTSNSTQEDYGKVAVYGNNVYVTYYHGYSASPNNIYLASSQNGGASFGLPIQVNRTTGKSDWVSNMGVDSSGNLFVAYSDTTSDGEGDLYVAKSSNGGTSFTYTLAADSTYRGQAYPRAFIDGNNYLHLLWNDNRDNTSYGSVYYTRSIDGGASYEANVNIDSLGGISNGSLYVDTDVVYLAVTDYKTSPYTTIFKKITWVAVDTVSPTTIALPGGGTYASAQSVTLTCSDGTGSGCDKIYYTTDGSTPTTSSSIYSTPISISASTILKFFAKDLAGNSETVKTEVYTLNETYAFVLQPGPGESKDIWTTSVYSYAPGGGGPGGGLDNEQLRVGGWADEYDSLLQFNLTGMPQSASSAILYLYNYSSNDGSPTGMYLDRITQPWSWTDRLWWANKPTTVQWNPGTLSAPAVGAWYAVDVSNLYNAWQAGTYPNYGLQLRPTNMGNNFNTFYSSDYLVDPTLRPKLIVVGSTSSDTTAPTTSATPAGGIYTSSQSVTLTCSDGTGSVCDKIYYTTDGTTPTTASTVYSTAISISATKTLKFFAKDLAGNSEAVKTESYTIDTTAPTGTISINSGAASTNSATATLTLSCTDAGTGCAEMQFSNDNATWSTAETYATSKTWTLATGDWTKTVYVKFKDTAGNWSSTTISDTIVFDATAPATTASPAGGTYNSTQSVTLTCSDVTGSGCDKIYYTTDGTTPTTASTVYSTAISVSATKTLKFFAKDLAGNNEAVKTATYTIDSTVPIFSSTAPASSSYINTTTVGYSLSAAVLSGKITFTRTGGSADSSSHIYNFTDSDKTVGTHSVNTGLSLINAGIYTVTFEAADLAGNAATVVSNTGVVYDNTSASVVLNSPSSNSRTNSISISYILNEEITSGEIVFTRTGGTADGLSPRKHTLGASEKTAGSHTADTGVTLIDGAIYTVGFESVTDKAGNATASVSNTNITYDSTSVAITNTSPASNAIITNSSAGYTLSEAASSGKVTFTRSGGNADSGSPHVYTLSGSDLYPGSHTVNTSQSLVDGAFYTVSFDATDMAGNPATTVSNAMVFFDSNYGIGPSGNVDNISYSNKRVDGYDLIKLSIAFGSHSGGINWNPVCDLDKNGTVEGSDLIVLGAHFGEVQ